MKVRQTILVGCGGTGGWLAEPLARLLRFHSDAAPYLTLVDKDEWEPHNAARQSAPLTGGLNNKAAATRARLMEAGFDAIGEPHYIDVQPHYIEGPDLLSLIAGTDYRGGLGPADGVVCVILAVDNDFTRASLIEALEDSPHDYLILNPGNGYDSFMLSAAARICGVPLGSSLLARYPQYRDPPLDAPQHKGCKDEEPSAPQLLTANLGAAWAALAGLEG